MRLALRPASLSRSFLPARQAGNAVPSRFPLVHGIGCARDESRPFPKVTTISPRYKTRNFARVVRVPVQWHSCTVSYVITSSLGA